MKRIFLYVCLLCLCALTISLIIDTRKVDYEIAPSIIDNPAYQYVKSMRGKYFGSCKKFADYLMSKYPEVKCKKYTTLLKTQHWECQIADNIWADANYRLGKGLVRVFIRH